ncbi:MAG: DUF4430 domain-containing protein [Clostridia bacterium]|nr:DUF4430 domain-containing protein [Clostridia bacterium]
MAVAALGMASCGNNDASADTAKNDATVTKAAANDVTEADATEAAAKEVTVTVEVTDDKGEVTSKEFTTSAATLADLLLSEKIAEGEDSEYGLYITTVNGITADYNTDGAYWALYKNGEYMMTGADGETLTDGAVYGLVYTKG